MRGLGILASALVLSAPAWASGFETQTRMNMPGITSETGAGQITSVKPGEPIAIACNALMAGPGADVRVVLTLAPVSGETETGYQKLMATNEEVLKGAVHAVPYSRYSGPGKSHGASQGLCGERQGLAILRRRPDENCLS